MGTGQLRLVGSTGQQENSVDIAARPDATGRVFERWVFMLGKNARRCVLGPERRRLIERALGLYDEATLLLAIDGCASSAWHAGQNDRGEPFQDLSLILRNERNIERFAELGERLHEAFERQQLDHAQAAASEESTPESAARAELARQRLREYVAAKLGRR